MRNLFLLFLKFGGVVVFLALEGLCMYLVVNHNEEQRDIYVSSSRVITGNITKGTDNIYSFFSLVSIADSLAEENADLYSRLDNSKFVQKITRDSIEDVSQMFTFIPGKVIKNSTNKTNNFLTLDRGRKHGIKKKMGVFHKDGIVGVVHTVSENFSVVMPVINVQFKVSASIKKNDYFGSLEWNSRDPLIAQLRAIPKHIELSKGDTIVTSGYSSIFPEGIMIGVIETYALESGSNFYDVDVKLGTDFYSLKYVYVIENLFMKELEEIEEEVGDE